MLLSLWLKRVASLVEICLVMLLPLWLKRVASLVKICLVMLLPLWLKRVASLVEISLVTLTSLAHKSHQFSRNQPSDAHLFGSIEELGKTKKKNYCAAGALNLGSASVSKFYVLQQKRCSSTSTKQNFIVISTKRCSGPPSTVMCTLLNRYRSNT